MPNSRELLVVFSHGKEGTPDGSKIRRLSAVASANGCQVLSLDYRNISSPEQRTAHLLETLKNISTPLLLVGSSMGAYSSIVASQQLKPQGLFLLAPALYLEGYQQQEPIPVAKLTTIIHGWHDEIVPVTNAINFAQQHHTRLHLVSADHRLLSAMDIIENIFAMFLREILS